MFSDLKMLLKHTMIYGLGTILSKAIGFLLIPIYTRYLTPKDYGILELLDLTTWIIGMFVGMGIGSAVLRFYSEYDGEKDKTEVVSTALLFSFGVILPFALILLQFPKTFSSLVFGTTQYTNFFRIIFISFLLDLTHGVPYSFIRVKNRSLLYTFMTTLRLSVILSLNIYFVVFLRKGVEGILYSGLITNGLVAISLVSITLREIKLSFSAEKLKKMLKYGIPLIPVALGMYLLIFADRFFLQRFSSLTSVGLYSLGYKFGMILNVLLTQPFLLIWSAQMFEIAKNAKAKETFSRILTYFCMVLVFFGLGLSLIIKDMLRLLVTPAFFDAHKIVPLIVLSYIIGGFYFHFQVGILLKKKTKYLSFIVGSAVLFNILLNFVLIPKYDMMGAAWATLLSYAFLSFCTYYVSSQLYLIPYEFKRIGKMLTVAVLLYLAGALISINSIPISLIVRLFLLLLFPLILYWWNFYDRTEREKTREIWLRVVPKLKTI